MKDKTQPTFRLTIRPAPSDVPPIIRLRHALKVLGRSFALRCTLVEEIELNEKPVRSTKPRGKRP